MQYFTLLMIMMFSIGLFGQKEMTSEDWRSDLRFFQKEVHEDYASLFRRTTAEAFDAKVDKLYVAIPELEHHQIVVELAKIVATFGYGHTALGLSAWDRGNPAGFKQYPYKAYQFSDGYFIQGVHKEYAKASGAKILKIGNRSIEEAVAAIYPTVSAENEQFFKAHGLAYLSVPEVLHAVGVSENIDQTTLLLEKAGEKFEMTFPAKSFDHFPGKYGLIQHGDNWLDARSPNDTPLWLKDLEKIFFFEYLSEHKAIYVRQSQVQDMPEETITEFYTRVFDFIEKNDVEKLIMDVRLNSGGNNFKNVDVVKGLIRCEKINQPGKFFVIIGRRTFSACQNLVNELEKYTEVTFVGEPTGEHVNFFGDVNSVQLPKSGIPIRLSFAWWQDKAPWDEREWMPPHISVEMSSKDYFNNYDPVLEAVWKAPAGARFDPLNHIFELFEQGKIEEVVKKSKEYTKDPQYRYVPFESNFLRGAKSLLAQARYQESSFTFNLLVELYPASSEGWLGLGQSLMKIGDKEKATAAFKKCIALDQNGKIGAKAKAALGEE